MEALPKRGRLVFVALFGVKAGIAIPSKVAGVCLLVGGVILFAGQDISIKYVAPFFPVLFLVWCRYASNFAFNLLYSAVAGELNLRLFATKHWRLQLLRSTLLVLTTILNFYAVSLLPLATYVSIFFTYPLIIAACAPYFLGERLPPVRWLLIGAGMAGVLLVMRPGTDNFSWPMLLVLGSALGFAFFSMLTRKLANTDQVHTTNVFTALVGTIMMAPAVLLLAGDWETEANVWQWGLALLSGIPFAGLGHLLLLHAHRFAPAPELAPWFYTQIIWITIGGYVVFGDLPDGFTILGCSLIITGCFLVLRLEMRSARRLASAQASHPNN